MPRDFRTYSPRLRSPPSSMSRSSSQVSIERGDADLGLLRSSLGAVGQAGEQRGDLPAS